MHVGGDEVRSEGFRSMIACMESKQTSDFEKLKQEFMVLVVKKAAQLGVSVQAWDDALAGRHELPQDAAQLTGGHGNIFINAWNSDRHSNAFTYADAGYKVLFLQLIQKYIFACIIV